MFNNDLLPGPEVRGEPFWCLMEWKNNKLTGNFFAANPGLCLFLREKDADYNRQQMPQHIRKHWVVRGINKVFLKQLLKLYEQQLKGLVKLLVVMPIAGGKKVPSLEMTPDEIRYYAKHKKFKDKELQKSINNICEMADNPPDEYERQLCLEPFFTYIEEQLDTFPRKYPNLSQELNNYRKQLWSDIENVKEEAKEIKDAMKPKEQIYSQVFHAYESSYKIEWSIHKAKEIIKKHDIKRQELSLETLIPAVDQSNIIESYLPQVANSKEPVIIAHYPLTDLSNCIIDGNHRIIAKYQAGETAISAYILEPKHHLQAMLFNLYRNFYKVHNNISEFFKYMFCQKELDELNLLSLNK